MLSSRKYSKLLQMVVELGGRICLRYLPSADLTSRESK